MRLRLMSDYECYPLWEVRSDGIRNLAPDNLPISATLKRELRLWADLYDKTLRRDDPASSGFASEEAESEFEDAGLRLWKELQSELGSEFEVTYFSQMQHREITG